MNAVCALPGARAASGGDDNYVRRWVWDEGATALRGDGEPMTGHSKGVRTLAAVDGRTLVSGSRDRTLRVWLQLPDGGDGRNGPWTAGVVLVGHEHDVLHVAVLGAAAAAAAQTEWAGNQSRETGDDKDEEAGS